MQLIVEGQLSFGFGAINISGPEGDLNVTVIKEGINTGNFFVRVTPLTFQLFDGIGFVLPDELPRSDRPFEATSKLSCR